MVANLDSWTAILKGEKPGDRFTLWKIVACLSCLFSELAVRIIWLRHICFGRCWCHTVSWDLLPVFVGQCVKTDHVSKCSFISTSIKFYQQTTSKYMQTADHLFWMLTCQKKKRTMYCQIPCLAYIKILWQRQIFKVFQQLENSRQGRRNGFMKRT
jgi:hypothetical protein